MQDLVGSDRSCLVAWGRANHHHTTNGYSTRKEAGSKKRGHRPAAVCLVSSCLRKVTLQAVIFIGLKGFENLPSESRPRTTLLTSLAAAVKWYVAERYIAAVKIGLLFA